jgi:hypothetical protein
VAVLLRQLATGVPAPRLHGADGDHELLPDALEAIGVEAAPEVGVHVEDPDR